MVNLQLGF